MRRADIITALALLAIGVVVLIEGLRLKVGWGYAGPEPGLYLFLLALGLIGSSAYTLVQTILLKTRSPLTESKPFVKKGGFIPVLKVAIPALGMVAIAQVIGLYLAGGLLLGFYMRWIGRHHWGLVLALGILLAIGSYLVFDKFFMIPLPRGSLGKYLPY